MLAPATGFYSTPGLGKQEVRLAYVLHVDAINQAMDCLELALKRTPENFLIPNHRFHVRKTPSKYRGKDQPDGRRMEYL